MTIGVLGRDVCTSPAGKIRRVGQSSSRDIGVKSLSHMESESNKVDENTEERMDLFSFRRMWAGYTKNPNDGLTTPNELFMTLHQFSSDIEDIDLDLEEDASEDDSDLQLFEECHYGEEAIEFPVELLSSAVFNDVFSFDTWLQELTESERESLLQYLPYNCDVRATLGAMFCGEIFHHHSPLHHFREKLSEGRYSPQVAPIFSNLQDRICLFSQLTTTTIQSGARHHCKLWTHSATKDAEQSL